MRQLVLVASLLVAGSCATAPPTAPSATPGALQRLQILQQQDAPVTWVLAGDTHAAALERLMAWADDHEIVVATAGLRRRNLHGHVSYSLYLKWIVLVDASLPANGRFYTLVHELAHIFSPPQLVTVARDEAYAELVAVQVCARVGLDAWRQTAAYLRANTTRDDQLAVAYGYGAHVDRTVATLAAAVQPR